MATIILSRPAAFGSSSPRYRWVKGRVSMGAEFLRGIRPSSTAASLSAEICRPPYTIFCTPRPLSSSFPPQLFASRALPSSLLFLHVFPLVSSHEAKPRISFPSTQQPSIPRHRSSSQSPSSLPTIRSRSFSFASPLALLFLTSNAGRRQTHVFYF